MITMERSSLIIVFLALASGCAFDASGAGAGNGGLEGDGVDGSAQAGGDMAAEGTVSGAEDSGMDGPLQLDRGLDLERSSDWEPNLDWDPEYDWENGSGEHTAPDSQAVPDWRTDFEWFHPGISSLSDYSDLEDWLIDLINALEIPCTPDAQPTGCWPGTVCNPDTSFCEVSR